MNKISGMLVVVLFSVSVRGADDNTTIRRQFAEYFTQSSRGDSSYMAGMLSNGAWADIDYTGRRRGNWPARDHLKRIQEMAIVYADPDAELFRSPALREAIINGLNHWIENDYRNPNWWYARIGVPSPMATAMILLDDELPVAVLENARPILSRSEMGMTGQNKVWCAGNNFMIGLLYDEPERMEKAAAGIWSELRVSNREGIQLDWSFHQHGPQQQFGNYGLAFAGDMIKWVSILRGTEYALPSGKLEILRNYILEGASWVVWHRRMDLSGCGRQIDQGAQRQKGATVMSQLMQLIQVDPSSASDCYLRHDFYNQLTGFKSFWRSEMGVQRRPDWYASVKMSSTRVIGSETCNDENMQGLHLGDGTLLVYLEGSEYEDLVPLWDWRRLPGTTCDQGLNNLKPGGADGGFGGSDFSGVIGDGETGVAAMIYKRGNLTARKAYFFLEDHIVCMGSGIGGKTKGRVVTSVEQSWLVGDVKPMRAGVWHNGIGYLFLTGEPALRAGMVDGNWNTSFPTRGDRPVSGDVFSLWIDHGESPRDERYAYCIFPGIHPEQADRLDALDGGGILMNSTTVQALETDDRFQAVFYEAGRVTLKSGQVVEVDGACLLVWSDNRLIITDPTHKLKNLTVGIDGTKTTVCLPQGDRKGSQVAVNFQRLGEAASVRRPAVASGMPARSDRDALE